MLKLSVSSMWPSSRTVSLVILRLPVSSVMQLCSCLISYHPRSPPACSCKEVCDLVLICICLYCFVSLHLAYFSLHITALLSCSVVQCRFSSLQLFRVIHFHNCTQILDSGMSSTSPLWFISIYVCPSFSIEPASLIPHQGQSFPNRFNSSCPVLRPGVICAAVPVKQMNFYQQV